MIKIEIVKKTFIEAYIYSLYVVVIWAIVKIGYTPEEGLAGKYIFMIFVLLVTLPIIPVLPLKKHKKLGYLIVEDDHIYIERQRRKESFPLSKINYLKIKLTGYKDQMLSKSMKYYRPQEMGARKFADGLGSYIRFNHRTDKYKYDLYFDEEDVYEELKTVLAQREENYPDIQLNIKR